MTQNQTAIIGLAHIGIVTEDIEASKTFYRDVLGFTLTNDEALVRETGTTLLAFLEAGDCKIELVQPADRTNVANRPLGQVEHVAMSVRDIDRVAQRLKEKGIAFEAEEPSRLDILGGAKSIFFQGPDGERLELFEVLA